jgi:hypothetical protein
MNMNLSPSRVERLAGHGFEADHWSTIGAATAATPIGDSKLGQVESPCFDGETRVGMGEDSVDPGAQDTRWRPIVSARQEIL